MAKLSNQAFYDKWVPLLADNVFQDIDGKRFEELLADMRDSFAQVDSQVAQPVPPAVNFDPVLRRLTAIHPLGVAELEYNHNNGGFTAYAPIQVDDLGHGQGEWRFRVAGAQGRNPSQLSDSPEILIKAGTGAAGPLSITANQISDASPAGRALLRAPTTDAQLAQLDYLRLADYPNLVRVYGENGAVKYLLDQVKQLLATAAPGAPVAPTDGQVEDTADTFSGKLVPGYSAVADYEVFGAPGFPGIVNASIAGADIQNGRIISRGLTGSIFPGGVGIRVAASGSRPAGAWMLNDRAFTGPAVVKPPANDTTPPNVSLTVPAAGAVLAPGTQVLLTATATDNVAVQGVTFTNGATGAVLGQGAKNGNTYTAPYTAGAAGPLTLVATATDAAGNSQSATVNVTVQAVANQLPTADAGSDLTIQLPTNQALLQGAGMDADGTISSYTWRQATGPSAVTGMPATTQNVVVSNLVAGTYQFGLYTTDNQSGKSGEDFIMVTVLAASAATTSAPVVVYTSSNRTLVAYHAAGGSLQYNYKNTGWVDYTGPITVDSAAHDPGDWLFRRLAGGGYAESPASSSPAIAPAAAQTAPGIRSISPTKGPVGISVTIPGLGFGASQGTGSVRFNATVATTITKWSDTEVIAVAPPGADPGHVFLTTNAGTTYASTEFFTLISSEPFGINSARFGQALPTVPHFGFLNQLPRFCTTHTSGLSQLGTAGVDTESAYQLFPATFKGNAFGVSVEIKKTFGTGTDVLRVGFAMGSVADGNNPSVLLLQYDAKNKNIGLIARNTARGPGYFQVQASGDTRVLPSVPQAIGLQVAAGLYINIWVRLGPNESDWVRWSRVTGPEYPWNFEFWRPSTMASITGGVIQFVSGGNGGATYELGNIQTGLCKGVGIANKSALKTLQGRYLEDGRYQLYGANVAHPSNDPTNDPENIAASGSVIYRRDRLTGLYEELCYLSSVRDWRGNARIFPDNAIALWLDEDNGDIIAHRGRWGGIARGETHMGMEGWLLSEWPTGDVVLTGATELPLVLPPSTNGQDVYGYDTDLWKENGTYYTGYPYCQNGNVQLRGVYVCSHTSLFGPMTKVAEWGTIDAVVKEGFKKYHESRLFTNGGDDSIVTDSNLVQTGRTSRTDTGVSVNPCHPTISDMTNGDGTATVVWPATDGHVFENANYSIGHDRPLEADKLLYNMPTIAFGLPAAYR